MAGHAPDVLDCAVIGGGPAGLTAAIYLARFHLSVTVFDAGSGRATRIPRTHNHAGFPEGISGRTLVARMRRQATSFGTEIVRGRVDGIERHWGAFTVRAGAGSFVTRTVLVATGVTNRSPELSPRDHARALRLGLLRYCPICDGYEATDEKIGVIGTGARGTDEAIFLRGFSCDVTLVPFDRHSFERSDRERLGAAKVTIVDRPAGRLRIAGSGRQILACEGLHAFDTVYPALGSDIHSDLARDLGASLSEDGCVLVDAHQRTDVPGLYAAGDVVRGLDQISHAMGEGGVAATTIRNDIGRATPIYR